VYVYLAAMKLLSEKLYQRGLSEKGVAFDDDGAFGVLAGLDIAAQHHFEFGE
jgi:hypothetical protein